MIETPDNPQGPSSQLAPGPLAEAELEREAQLDPELQFPHALSSGAQAPRCILLTGATGFLGAHLLEELLRATSATLFCLVRASDDAAAADKLLGQLRVRGLWSEQAARRIAAVAGELGQPLLGLSRDRFAELAAQIDVIFHCAGWINMALPYARLRATNVLGTREVLRLAGTAQTKPVHFVSTIAVFYSDAHGAEAPLSETVAPRFHASLKGGYSKSKWVADRLVASAGERGLPVCIYRPVRLMGHSQTGAMSDMSDLLPMLLKGCILLGKYPAWDIEVTFVPVDYASRAIVQLAGQAHSWGRAFHLFNPRPMRWRELMAILSGLGYRLEEVSYERFWQELKQRRLQSAPEPAGDKNFLSRLILGLTAPHFLLHKRPQFDGSNTAQGLAGAALSCPPISPALIATYVRYWKKVGYLPSPADLSGLRYP